MTRAVNLANLADTTILAVDGVHNRVGVGSTQPSTNLDVVGNIHASGNLTVLENLHRITPMLKVVLSCNYLPVIVCGLINPEKVTTRDGCKKYFPIFTLFHTTRVQLIHQVRKTILRFRTFRFYTKELSFHLINLHKGNYTGFLEFVKN